MSTTGPSLFRGPPVTPARRLPARTVLVAILLLAATARLAGMRWGLPGLNQDEAVNAWNAWCLLHTGRDASGAAWPLFYMHALGENRSALQLYFLLPFQAVGGLNVATTRLPAVLASVASVALLYWLGRRLFDPATGLIAAGLLALSPWHIVLGSWGHEAALTPLLITGALAAVIWAGLPVATAAVRPASWRALAAGLAAGLACYGYPAVRIELPLVLTAALLSPGRAWMPCLKRPRAPRALAFGLLGFGLTFGPLAWHHVAHPEQIGRRAAQLRLWQPEDDCTARARLVAQRYAAHFGPEFLFQRGDRYEMQHPRGFGVLAWYTLPVIAAGLVSAIGRARREPAARLLLAWVLLYPAGDALHRHIVAGPDDAPLATLHVLRSAPGLVALALLAGVGAVALWRTVGRLAGSRRIGYGLLALAGLAIVALDGRFLAYYLGRHAHRPEVYHNFHADLVQACGWLRPRLAGVDAAFVTTSGMNIPYVVVLVATGYDAQAWLRGPRETHVIEGLGWEDYSRVGPFRFIYDSATVLAEVDALRGNDRRERVVFIMRPNEISLRDPVLAIRGPAGRPVLLVFEQGL